MLEKYTFDLNMRFLNRAPVWGSLYFWQFFPLFLCLLLWYKSYIMMVTTVCYPITERLFLFLSRLWWTSSIRQRVGRCISTGCQPSSRVRREDRGRSLNPRRTTPQDTPSNPPFPPPKKNDTTSMNSNPQLTATDWTRRSQCFNAKARTCSTTVCPTVFQRGGGVCAGLIMTRQHLTIIYVQKSLWEVLCQIKHLLEFFYFSDSRSTTHTHTHSCKPC